MAAESVETEIAKLSAKLAQNPASRIFAPLADAYRSAGRTEEAIEICRRGLRHHPDYLGGQMVLARCYHDRGDLELAAGAFEQVLRADPQNLVALRALGEIANERGDVEGASERYRRALEIDPTNVEMAERLEEIRARGDAPREEKFQDASEPSGWGVEAAGAVAPPTTGLAGRAGPPAPARPGEEIATVTLAEVYAEQGLHERALGIYRRILAEDPGNGRIRAKAEELERRIAEERARLDAESGSRLAGFVPGELRVTGDEAVLGRSQWEFLLEDEADRDPDEVFASGGSGGPVVGAPGPAGEARAGGAEEDDLKKFQEWLHSLK